MTIASTATAAKAGLAKRFAALAVAAATLLAGGAFAAPASAADDPAPAETNVALNADKGNDNAPDVSVSYVTGWNSTAALNDGSLDGNASYGGWGTWGNTSDHETATYTWGRAVTTSKSVGYYWTNVKTGDGGVQLPKSVSIEYLNADSGQYETVPNLKVDQEFPSSDQLEANKTVYGPYTYTFDQVTTTSLRLVVNKQANDNKGITVTEWQVFGTSAPVSIDPGDPDAFLYTQQVAVRTTPGVDPTSKLPAEVWVTPEDGPSLKVPVTWEAVPADAYATAGTTAEVKGATKSGTYDGIKVEAGQVTATIGVYDQLNTEVTDAEYVSTVTTPKVKPVLQDTVALTYADGSVESGHKVTWDAIPAADYAEAEQMGEVSGAIEGTGIKASATFFVVEPSDPKANPIVALSFNSEALGATGWYTSTPKFTITAQRGVSTVPIDNDKVEYKIGDGAWAKYTNPVLVNEQGKGVTISARATDEQGRTGETSQTIDIDTNKPTVTAKKGSQNGNDVVVSLTASDGDKGSGITRVLFSTGPSSNPKSNENTMWATYVDADKIKVQLSVDHDTFVNYYSTDAAGNTGNYGSLNLGKGEAVALEPSVESVAIAGDGVKDGKLALTEGDKAALKADVKVTGAVATTVTWKSSDEKTATVDKDGNVTAVASGKATITATSTADTTKSASVEVTVAAKPVPVDKSGLKAAVELAGKLNQSAYTSDTWKTFADALASAQKVLADDSATQAQVDAAQSALADAVAGLKPVEQKPTVDKSGLKVSVEVANKLDKSAYTAESWKVLADALDAAQKVLDNADATQAQVADAQQKLVEAVAGLEKVTEPTPTPVVKDGLKATVDAVNAKNLKESDYTPETWKVLADALASAQAVLDNDAATQDQVTDAQTALVKAVLGLETATEPEQKPVDKSALEAEVAKAAAIDRSQYTDKSLKLLDAAIAAANDVLGNESATAKQVSDAKDALTKALAGLEKKAPTPSNPGNNNGNNNGNAGSGNGAGNGSGSNAGKGNTGNKGTALSKTGSAVAALAALTLLLAAAGTTTALYRKRQ